MTIVVPSFVTWFSLPNTAAATGLCFDHHGSGHVGYGHLPDWFPARARKVTFQTDFLQEPGNNGFPGSCRRSIWKGTMPTVAPPLMVQTQAVLKYGNHKGAQERMSRSWGISCHCLGNPFVCPPPSRSEIHTKSCGSRSSKKTVNMTGLSLNYAYFGEGGASFWVNIVLSRRETLELRAHWFLN